MSECKHHLGFHEVEYEEECCRICGDTKYEIKLKAEVGRLREAGRYYDFIGILIQGLKSIKQGEENPQKIAIQTLAKWDSARIPKGGE